MKIKDITKKGFYRASCNPEIIYEVFKNTDDSWLKEKPEDKLIIDEWQLDYIEAETGCKIYQTTGGLFTRHFDLANIDVEPILNCDFEIFGKMGAFLRQKDKPLYLVLKYEWFDKIKTGKKTKEYREVKHSWNSRLTRPEGFYKSVIFQRGFTKNPERMEFEVKKIYKSNEPNDLGLDKVWVIELGRRLK